MYPSVVILYTYSLFVCCFCTLIPKQVGSVVLSNRNRNTLPIDIKRKEIGVIIVILDDEIRIYLWAISEIKLVCKKRDDCWSNTIPLHPTFQNQLSKTLYLVLIAIKHEKMTRQQHNNHYILT